MTAALLERKPEAPRAPLPGLRLLVLARIACEEGASRAELAREVGPYVGDDTQTRLGVDRELVELIRKGLAIENKARFTASPAGFTLLLDVLALKALPRTWSELLEIRIVAKALGIERESIARLKGLQRPDVLRAEILIAAYRLELSGSTSASRLRAALALVALERAFGNKIKSELTTSTGFNAKAARVLAGQLLKRPRDAGTDKRLVTFLAAEHVGALKIDADTVRNALIRRWAGMPPERPQLTDMMPQTLPRPAAPSPAPQSIPAARPSVPAPSVQSPPTRSPAASRPDLPGFVKIVKTLASGVAEGWPGSRKALVSRVYVSIATTHPDWGLSLVEFKAMLAECHRIGHLILTTADLKDKRQLDELRQSAISYKNTVWHLVRVEE